MDPTELWTEQTFCCPKASGVCGQAYPKAKVGELPAGTCPTDQVAMAVGAAGESGTAAYVCVSRSDYLGTRAVFPYDPLRKSLLCSGMG
jgi:hypothetical protein